MKKVNLIAVALLIFVGNLFSQKDSIFVGKSVDDMEDKSYYYPSSDLVISNEGKTKGIRLSAFIDEKDGEIWIGDLSVKMVNIGSCVEKNELIIMFEDSSKISLTSWNKFNCKGDAWFNISSDDIEKLSTLKMKKIKITNGYTFDSFTKAVPNPDYYRQLFYAVKTKKIKKIKE